MLILNIFALDIGGTAIKHAMVTQNGDLQNLSETATKGLHGDRVIEIMYELCDKAAPFDAIGISTTGIVDSQKGMLLFADDSIPGWSYKPLKQLFSERYGVPVAVENDVNSIAVAEGALGAAKGKSNYICVAMGNGIGGAIVADGHLVRGASFGAGEIGHFTYQVGGRDCPCGRKGCFTTYASTSALVEDARALQPSIANGRQLFELAQDSKPLQEVIDRWIEHVACGLCSLIHILDPGTVVLGGGVMSRPGLVERIAERAGQNLMVGYENTVITAAKLGNTAGLLGAAHLAGLEVKA